MARTAEAAVNQRSYVSTHRPDYYIEAPKQQPSPDAVNVV